MVSEKAAPDICVTSSGFPRHLVPLGLAVLSSSGPPQSHRLSLQRRLGSPFIMPVEGPLRKWSVV